MGTCLAAMADTGTSMAVMADMGTSLAGTDMDTAMDMALGSDMDARTDWVTDFPTVSQFTPNLLSQQQHLSPQPQLNPRILAHTPTLLLLLTVVSRPWGPSILCPTQFRSLGARSLLTTHSLLINPLVISRSSPTLARLTITSPSMRRSLLTSLRQHTSSSLPSMGRRRSRFIILLSQLTRSIRHTTHHSLLTHQKKNPKRVFNILQRL